MDSIRPIHGARDHKVALTEIDVLLAAGKLTKAQNARLEVLTVLVSDYEDRAFPTGGMDPIDLLEAHMRNSGRTQKDLADMIGRGLASLVLNRQRAMSLAVIRKISNAWGIPADLLISPYELAAKRA
jgi:HTH-type transcriptional regulator / antitoxin HigA